MARPRDWWEMELNPLVTGGVPKGSVLGLVLFHYFINSLCQGIKCCFSQPSDNTKLDRSVDLEGREALQVIWTGWIGRLRPVI